MRRALNMSYLNFSAVKKDLFQPLLDLIVLGLEMTLYNHDFVFINS